MVIMKVSIGIDMELVHTFLINRYLDVVVTPYYGESKDHYYY